MSRLFSVFFILLSVFTFLGFTCLSKKRLDTGNYIISEKYQSKKYNEQILQIKNCYSLLPETLYKQKIDLLQIYVQNAIKKVERELSEIDIMVLHKRKFSACFEILGEFYIDQFLCNGILDEILKVDTIEFYALKEYEECLRQKNEPYIREIKFTRPKIGIPRPFTTI
ncbi:hypothetical protein GVAV_001730 [Gurleya vavrai]